MTRAPTQLSKSAEQLLVELATRKTASALDPQAVTSPRRERDIAALLSADLLTREPSGAMTVSAVGRAHLARRHCARTSASIDPFRAQHLDLAERTFDKADGKVTVDDGESPLAWLARRKGRDGRKLIEPVQFQAGERLRAEFTRSQLMPRTTANWGVAVTDDRRSAGLPATFADAVIAARQRVRAALNAVGPEFAGLLLDVCCFLKSLADIENERGWPPRSAKVVLQLGLDRLARHYGFAAEARGPSRAPVRTWLAPDAAFLVDQ